MQTRVVTLVAMCFVLITLSIGCSKAKEAAAPAPTESKGAGGKAAEESEGAKRGGEEEAEEDEEATEEKAAESPSKDTVKPKKEAPGGGDYGRGAPDGAGSNDAKPSPAKRGTGSKEAGEKKAKIDPLIDR